MKQATQLEIDFGPELRTPASVVPGAEKVHFLQFDRAELRALDAISKASARLKSLVPAMVLLAQAAAAVLGCFALMFLAAIIQG